MGHIEFTEEQEQAIDLAREKRVSILTGGPGTGKTTTCREIIRWARSEGLKVSLCAPSGKAAKTLQEYTDHRATTIHKLLESYMNDSGNFVFRKDASNPIDAQFLVVDEVSMISNSLMARLVDAIPFGTRILLVGDQDQLPPVGAGAILRDLLWSKRVPHTELSVIHRHQGSIVNACHEIKVGKLYTPDKTINLEEGKNLRHIERESSSLGVDEIVNLVASRLPKRKYGFWDIQVITALKDIGDFSVVNLNKKLQRRLNSENEIEKFSIWPQDKVIQTRNVRCDVAYGKDHYEKGYIVNGDLGQVESIGKKHIFVRFRDPERYVRISRTGHDLQLAYAITCHKFQGSQSPVVVIPIHKVSGRHIPTRPWIYTALSRAQELCITVGQMSAIEKAIKREASNRITTLVEQVVKDRYGYGGENGTS